MMLMHYNIFEGGGDRLPRILNVVRAHGPDVVGILEANGWHLDGRKVLRRAARETALDHGHLTETATGYHIAVLARRPARFLSVREGFHHALAGLACPIDGFGELAVLFYHGNPHSEDKRVAETRHILEAVSHFTGAVVMGDFNALSLDDPYDRASLLENLRAHGIGKYGSRCLRFDAVENLKRGGLVDAAASFGAFAASTPTPVNADPAHAVAVRIDYAFVTANVLGAVQRVAMIRSEETERASDHYPLVLDLDVDRIGRSPA